MKETKRYDIHANHDLITWRINDHRSEKLCNHTDLNMVLRAPQDMLPHEVVLKVTTPAELRKMKLVLSSEEYDTSKPVIHVYELEN